MAFRTIMDIDPATKIVALSDVHGDIDALIIALRDCGQVIAHDDPQLLNDLLNLDLNNDQEAARFIGNEGLGFRWIGGTSHVVVIGDMLDNIRTGYTPEKIIRHKRDFITNEYPQTELKIILLLNALDILAEQAGGKVIKLIGNHESGNFVLYGDNLASRYASNPHSVYASHYPTPNLLSRLDYFKFNNVGFKLFMNRGSGVVLKINNNIFIHGDLSVNKNFDEYDTINKWLNTKDLSESIDLSSRIYPLFMTFKSDKGPLWTRKYGEDQQIAARAIDPVEQSRFCDSVVEDIRRFCQGIICDIDNIKVIIGHCQQMYSSWYDTANTTFTQKRDMGNVTILTPPSQTGRIDTPNDFVFGITMECDKDGTSQNHRIYKVDVGASKAFDQLSVYKNASLSENHFKKWMLSRMPQILQIIGSDVSIIRSNIKNTMQHQRRDLLEATNVPEVIDLTTPAPPAPAPAPAPAPVPVPVPVPTMPGGGNNNLYKQKYMKYKAKYLEIKKLFS
jgi:hypothetical protein